MRRASSRPGDSLRFQTITTITPKPSGEMTRARWHRRSSSLVATIAILSCYSQAVPCQPAASQAPLTLRALLDSVRVNHPTVLAAESRIRAADGIGVTARALGNPVLIENDPRCFAHIYTLTSFAGARWISRISPWCTLAT